jgi:hypothetical protein
VHHVGDREARFEGGESTNMTGRLRITFGILSLVLVGCSRNFRNFNGSNSLCPAMTAMIIVNGDNGAGTVTLNGISVHCPVGGQPPVACGPVPCSQGGPTTSLGVSASCTYPDGYISPSPMLPAVFVMSFQKNRP